MRLVKDQKEKKKGGGVDRTRTRTQLRRTTLDQRGTSTYARRGRVSPSRLQAKWSLSIRTSLPPVSYQVLLPLTQVNHERNKPHRMANCPPLKSCCSFLLGLFAQLHHCNSAADTTCETTAANSIRNLHKGDAHAPHRLCCRSRERQTKCRTIPNLPRPLRAPACGKRMLLILFVAVAANSFVRRSKFPLHNLGIARF